MIDLKIKDCLSCGIKVAASFFIQRQDQQFEEAKKGAKPVTDSEIYLNETGTAYIMFQLGNPVDEDRLMEQGISGLNNQALFTFEVSYKPRSESPPLYL